MEPCHLCTLKIGGGQEYFPGVLQIYQVGNLTHIHQNTPCELYPKDKNGTRIKGVPIYMPDIENLNMSSL